ncbi:hypothetical protein B5F07_08705 [Lachnoclostridium sp. An169]|nr:hypothetical protein B5F07_08705 [Lachnoclostridium sp. An169]
MFDETVKIPENVIPESTAYGYLGNKPGVKEKEGIPVIFKYQNVDMIYQNIRTISSAEAEDDYLDHILADTRMVVFISAQGGCGTSAAAAAYALRRAADQKKIFYLNMEKFGNSNLYFSGEESQEAAGIQQDLSGVDAFSGYRDSSVLSENDDKALQVQLENCFKVQKYDELVIDLSGNMEPKIFKDISGCADRIVYVTDGSLSGRDKFTRFCEAVKSLEQKNSSILEKVVLMYNRFDPADCEQIVSPPVPVMGGIVRFESVSGRELAERISQIGFVGKI